MNVFMCNGAGFDYMTSQLCEGFWLLHKAEQIKFRALNRNTHHGALVDDMPTVRREEVDMVIDWADLVVFTSIEDEWMHKIVKNSSIKHKRVFIDMFDSDAFHQHPNDHLVLFKREMRYPNCDKIAADNVRSLTFSIYQSFIYNLDHDYDNEWDKRDIDLSFVAFGGSNTMRINAVDVLKDIKEKLGWNVVCEVLEDGQPLSIDEYRDILKRSKIALSLPGAGYDTNRYWEIPGHGAVLCSYNLDCKLKIRNNFENDRHCIFFDNWQYMVEKCSKIVKDKNVWVRMRSASDIHIKHHSTVARAIDVIEMSSEFLRVAT